MDRGRVPVVGIVGAPLGVLIAEVGIERALALMGMNTGNLLFQHACWKLIQNPKLEVRFGDDPDFIRSAIDVLCLPAANQVNPAWDLGGWAEFIERIDKPLVIAGLGCQAEIGKTAKIQLKPGTKRFLKLISERAATIGVRGSYTASVLAANGVHNTRIAGCPSGFTNRDVSGERIARRIAVARGGPLQKINYLFGTMEEGSRASEKHLLQIAMNAGARIVYQTNPLMLRFLWDGARPPEFERYAAWETSFFGIHGQKEEHLAYLRRHGAFFSDAKTWIDDFGRCDLSFGPRIHGAVAAVQGGSLGVCVAFDARTLELAETMAYPYVPAAEVSSMRNVRDLTERIRFDPKEFETRRSELAVALEECLERHGVQLRKPLVLDASIKNSA